MDVTPVEIQLNVVLANIQQVLSMRQLRRLQPAVRTLQLHVTSLISPPRHIETVTLDDGTQADVYVVKLNAAALILLPVDSDNPDV